MYWILIPSLFLTLCYDVYKKWEKHHQWELQSVFFSGPKNIGELKDDMESPFLKGMNV